LYNAINDGYSPVVWLEIIPDDTVSYTYKGTTHTNYYVDNTSYSIIPLNIIGDITMLDSYVYVANEPVLYIDELYTAESRDINADFISSLQSGKIQLGIYASDSEVTFNINNSDNNYYADIECSNVVGNYYLFSESGSQYNSISNLVNGEEVNLWVTAEENASFSTKVLGYYQSGGRMLYRDIDYSVYKDGTKISDSHVTIPIKLECNDSQDMTQGYMLDVSVSGYHNSFDNGVFEFQESGTTIIEFYAPVFGT